MIYNLNDPREYLEACEFFENAVAKRGKIEMRSPRKRRSTKQNAFYYFMLRYFAVEYGCTVTEAALIYMKQIACPDIFEVTTINKFGQEIHTYRSSADLTTAEMSSAIRNFMAWAASGGIIIPEPDDHESIRYCERIIEQNESMI